MKAVRRDRGQQRAETTDSYVRRLEFDNVEEPEEFSDLNSTETEQS